VAFRLPPFCFKIGLDSIFIAERGKGAGRANQRVQERGRVTNIGELKTEAPAMLQYGRAV